MGKELILLFLMVLVIYINSGSKVIYPDILKNGNVKSW